MNETRHKDEVLERITNLLLTNPRRLIREEDLKNVSQSMGDHDFEQIINEAYGRLMDVGFELISSTFMGQRYYVLTTEGKDDEMTPSQYGTLALILALSKEVDENLKEDELKEIFSEVWSTDVRTLLKRDHLRRIKMDKGNIIKVTPLAKAIMKNVIKDLKLKNLIEVFK